jgi:tetratricopeptide (TPR) repeat protein
MHPPFDVINALLETPQQQETLRHLLDCPRCRRLVSSVLAEDSAVELEEPGDVQESGPPASPTSIQRLLLRAFDLDAPSSHRAAVEANDAGRLVEELLQLPEERRSDAVHRDPRFRSRPLAEILLAWSADVAADDPLRSRQLASLAATVVEALPPTAPAQRLAAEAYCLLAAAERRRGCLDAAEELLAAAIHALRDDRLDLMVRGFLCRTLAALRRDQNRIDEALALLARAREVYEETGDDYGLTRASAEEGWLLLEEYDAEKALTLLRSAYAMSDHDRTLGETLSTLQAMALSYAELGSDRSVKQVLARMRDLSTQGLVKDTTIRQVEAETEWRLGDHGKAIEILAETFEALAAAGPPIEAVKTGVILLQWHLELRKPVPERLLTAMAGLRLPPPFGAVVELVVSLHRGERAGDSIDCLVSALAYLERAQLNSELVYQPLEEPRSTLEWDSMNETERDQAAARAGIRLDSHGQPRTARERDLMAWTYEATTGVRIHFQAGIPGADPDEDTHPG